MTEPKNITELQLERLLQLVDKRRDEQCQQLLDEATLKARQLLDDTYRQARQHLHQELHAARARSDKRLSAAHAEQNTQTRQWRQKQEQALLKTIAEPLKNAMLKRWREPTRRQQWITSVLQQARQSLLDTRWRVQISTDVATEERQKIHEQMQQHGLDISLEPDPGIEAGIRVCTPYAEVDGTLDGLLSHQQAIESRVLTRLREPSPTGECHD